MKNILLGIIVLVIIGGSIWKNSSSSSGDTIKIGYVSPLTGDAATYGEPMYKAAQLAVDEINNNGGIDGKNIELIPEDSKCVGKDALSAVQKLISIDKVKFISGFTCAEDVLTSASVIEKNKVIAPTPK